MLIDFMHVLNYLSISWIVLVFLWILFSLIFQTSLSKSNWKIGIVITIFSFSIFSFNYKPSIYTDLYRHYEFLDLIRSNNVSFYYSHEFITSFLFDMVARTKHNQFLPFFITIIRYSFFFISFYIFVKTYKISSYYSKFFLFFHFAFFPLIESIAGIRYYFAVTILSFLIIHEFFIRKKITNNIYMLIPLTIHTSSGMFLGLRILVFGTVYKFIRPFKYLLLFWSLFYLQISEILKSFGLTITDTAANSLIIYAEEEREISINLVIARILLVIIFIIIFNIFKKTNKESFSKNINYYHFLELVLLFTIGSVFMDVFFQRNVFFLALIIMPLFMNFFESKLINKKLKVVFSLIILILSVGMYANQIYGLFTGYF